MIISSIRRKLSTKKKRRGKLSSTEYNAIKRGIEQIYIYRYTSDDDPDNVTDHIASRNIYTPQDDIDFLYNLSLELKLHWQCATITYNRDQWNKLYRDFGFARTHQLIKARSQGITPLIEQAKNKAEKTANLKHAYARAAVIAPWTARYPSVIPLLERRKSFLQLFDSDIAAIQDDGRHETTRYEIEPPDDIYRQIAQLL